MNAGDRAGLEAFLKAHYSQSVLRGRDPGELASGQLQMLAGRAGIELASIEKSSASEIVAILKSRGVLPRFARISWRLDDANPQLVAGGGDSTVGDLLRFANALHSNQLVSAAMTQTITTGKVQPQPGTPAGTPDKYAYGFFDGNANGRRKVGHGGGAPGMNADLSILWDHGSTVIVLANLDPPAAQDVSAYILDRLP